MAHPGLWGIGGIAVALITAGVWLNMPEEPAPAERPDPPRTEAPLLPGSAPAPAPAAPASPPVDPPEPQAGDQTETPADPRPPAGLISRVDGEGGILATPERPLLPFGQVGGEAGAESGADGLPSKPDTPPPPTPLPAAPLDSEEAVAPPPDEQAAAPRPDTTVFVDPGRYRGAPVLREAEGARLGLASAGIAMTGARNMLGGQPFFGALAISVGAGTTWRAGVHGYASLAAAEAEALARCARLAAADCVVAVHLLPQDFDGRREGTLTLNQAAEWSVFTGLSSLGRNGGGYAVFAISDDGGVGVSAGERAEQAERQALDRCESHRRRLALEEPAMAGNATCRVIARHGQSPESGAEGEMVAGPEALPLPMPVAEPVAVAEPVPLAEPDGDRFSRFTTYEGPGVWRMDPPESFDIGQRAVIEHAINTLHGDRPYFGAAAFAMAGDSYGIVTGYSALGPAEAMAMRQCRSAGETCSIVARLVPTDFDGRRGDTLNAAQSAALSNLRRQMARTGLIGIQFHALAWSEDGGAGTGSMTTASAARLIALGMCRRSRLDLPSPDPNLRDCNAAEVGPPAQQAPP
jgi:hypothetical protein